mgnify:CR=1 FL=1
MKPLTKEKIMWTDDHFNNEQGNSPVFHKDDVASAVAWLKTRIKKQEKDWGISLDWLNESINEAFSGVVEAGEEKLNKEFIKGYIRGMRTYMILIVLLLVLFGIDIIIQTKQCGA